MEVDLIVIGGGPGGYTAAIQGAKEGLSVLLVEESELGGTCLNRGCIPTKALLHSSNCYQQMLNARNLGVICDNPTYDIQKIYENKDRIVQQLVQGIHQLIQANKITYCNQSAYLVNSNTVLINEEEVRAKDIILACGCKPNTLAIEGMNHPRVYTSDDVLNQPIETDELVIIGGGVIGVELATFYLDLGKKVTIVEGASRILPTCDKEIANNLASVLKKKGAKILSDCKVIKIEENGQLQCVIESKQEEQRLDCDAILMSIGRRANSEKLSLEANGIEMERGFIKVNQRYQTNINHLYAIGDINGGIQLAHVASAQGKDCVSMIVGKVPLYQYSLIPSCIYTNPEIAYVGLTLEQATALGIRARSSKILMNTNGKHLIETSQRGFVRVVVDNNQLLIGALLFCDKATELVSYFTNMIEMKIPVEDWLKVIYPHPTISEIVKEIIEDLCGEAIHVLPKLR